MKKQAQPNLVELLNLNAFEPAEQEEMLLTLADVISRGTLLRLVEKMDPKTEAAFEKLLNEQDVSEDAALSFLEKHIPGAAEAARETVAEITADLAALAIPAAA